MKYFSVFSGVEGIGQGLDGEPVGFSETDKYASMVLRYRYPNVKNYGDIRNIRWEEIPDFDILVGGSPCQDFSIAGKRAGLGGARSSLAWEFIRGLRNKQPRGFIWENVKGVMSSRGGWDFASLLCAFSESGYNLWWQILNAKDFGVPQNRERVFVVGVRGQCPKEIFFERKDNPKDNVIPTLTGRYYGGQANGAYIGNKPKQIVGGSQGYRVYGTDGTSTTLASQAGGVGAKTGLYAVDTRRQGDPRFYEDFVPSLNSRDYKGGNQVTAMPLKFLERNQKNYQGEYSFTVDSAQTGGIMQGTKIRRLTPVECERLMSWPDNWTKWGINEKGETVEISDSQRYKLCGNGVVSLVIKEIQQVLSYEN